MKCKKIKQYQSKFRPQDFNHEFGFLKKEQTKQAKYNEKDMSQEKNLSSKMMGFIEIENVDIEINGEIVSGNNEIIKIITYIISSFADVRKNVLDYYVVFQAQEYRLQTIELFDFNHQYIQMICKRSK